jgi:recombination protein RecR
VSRFTDSIEKLIESLVKLPGIGRRSAERIAGYVLDASADEVKRLAEALVVVKETVRACSVCHNLSEGELCAICRDARRAKDIVCVVENPKDINAIEKAGAYQGVYHVLMGAISPLEGRAPADLKIQALIDRIKQGGVREVIIATDADTEGESTALYLTQLLKPLGVQLSRIGLGLPMGSNLEYADAGTLSKSLQFRHPL